MTRRAKLQTGLWVGASTVAVGIFLLSRSNTAFDWLKTSDPGPEAEFEFDGASAKTAPALPSPKFAPDQKAKSAAASRPLPGLRDTLVGGAPRQMRKAERTPGSSPARFGAKAPDINAPSQSPSAPANATELATKGSLSLAPPAQPQPLASTLAPANRPALIAHAAAATATGPTELASLPVIQPPNALAQTPVGNLAAASPSGADPARSEPGATDPGFATTAPLALPPTAETLATPPGLGAAPAPQSANLAPSPVDPLVAVSQSLAPPQPASPAATLLSGAAPSATSTELVTPAPAAMSPAAGAPVSSPTATVPAAGVPSPASGATAPAPALTTPTIPDPQFGREAPGVMPVAASPAGLVLPAAPATNTAPGSSTSVLPAKPTAQQAQLAQNPAPTRLQAAGGAPPSLSPDDELLLEIKLANGLAADTIVAYGTRSGTYLPLGALARIFDLAIVVSDDGQYAKGWFLDEKRTLTIDLRQSELELLGKAAPFPQGLIVAYNGEMYIRDDYLGELLPLTAKPDLREQSLTILTREPFPFEAKLAREEARARLANQSVPAFSDLFPREPTPWRLLDYPALDAELRGVSDNVLGTRGEADLRVAMDLAYLSAQAYLSTSTRDGLTAARIELGRQDPYAGLLGPLQATQFQMGDVATFSLPIGLRGTSGRGAYVTNAPLQQASIFENIDLRGPLPDGYEVELYRNNVLIGSTRISVNGQYEFLQVPVDFGLNVMRLVFYGPQGQRREEVRQINVGDGRLAKGEFVYSFSAAQKDRNLLDVYGPNFNPSQNFGAWRSTAQLSYGFSSGLTGTLSAAAFQTDKGDRWQASAGLRTSLAGISTRLDLGLQNGGGKAVQVGLGGRLFGTATTLTHAEYDGEFVDEVRAFSGDFLRRATELNINGTINLGGENKATLPLSGRFKRLEFADGRTETEASLRGSTRLGTLYLSNNLEYRRNASDTGPTTSQLLGSFDLARLSGSRTQLRGGLGYGIHPDFKLISANASIDHAIDDKTLVSASLGRNFDSKETSLGLSATRRFDRFTLGLDSSLSLPTKNYAVALRLGFSLGRNPTNQRVFMDRPGFATSGAVAVRAYHDSDGDNRFGPADTLLPEVNFFSGSSSETTDKDGIALIGELPVGNRASIQIDPDSIPDITLAPKTRGIEIVPRPGRIHTTDFAVVEVAEIAGTAFATEGPIRREVGGLRLELVDSKGKVAAQARSESDGYFFFERVLPGTYSIRVEPDQQARLGIEVEPGNAIEVQAGKPVPSIELSIRKRS